MDQLLSLLRHNARAPIEDLARELALSEQEVARKIEQLEREGVILGYQAVVDMEKRAANFVTAVVEVKLTPERGGGFDRLANRIARFDEVQSCYLMSGGYDLLVIVEGGTLQEIARFIAEKLATIKGVIGTATRFRLKTYKENGVSLAQEEKAQRLAVTP
jgi:DNA-binding Lrp family transcriptional regulator